MRFWELTETISLTQHYHEIEQYILSAINKTFKESEQHSNMPIKGLLLTLNSKNIASALEQFANKYSPVSNYPISIMFTSLIKNRNGECIRNKIKLNDKFIIQINDIIMHNEKFNPQKLNKLIGTFSHELVHAYQHITQIANKREKPEYRSYIAKQKDFDRSLYKIEKNIADNIDYERYFASPQEIPAFAHTIAVYLIDMAQPDPVNEQNVNDIIENIDVILKDVPTWIEHPIVDAYHSVMKEQYYKVYKKLLKLTYNEIINYRNMLQEKFK